MLLIKFSARFFSIESVSFSNSTLFDNSFSRIIAKFKDVNSFTLFMPWIQFKQNVIANILNPSGLNLKPVQDRNYPHF